MRLRTPDRRRGQSQLAGRRHQLRVAGEPLVDQVGGADQPRAQVERRVDRGHARRAWPRVERLDSADTTASSCPEDAEDGALGDARGRARSAAC
jgi:hypothetical protein